MEPSSGKLVALEGDVESISTHLRLLPPSQKILILPSLVDNLPNGGEGDHFNARTFVRDVHTRFLDRTETAWSFLRSSTPAHPRLVLMNGGSVTARTTCISRICENLTDGDVKEAGKVFNEMVDGGVAGLMRPEDVSAEDGGEDNVEGQLEQENEHRVKEPLEGAEIEEDPSLKAMKAADSLDRETALLQQAECAELASNVVGEDPYISKTPRQSLAGIAQIARAENDTVDQYADDIVRTVLTIPTGLKGSRGKHGIVSPSALTTPFTAASHYSYAHSHQSEDWDDDEDEPLETNLISPGNGSVVSPPHTLGVIYGEARIIDVQVASPKTPTKVLRKVKSMDRFFPSDAMVQAESSKPPPLIHTRSAFDLRQPPTMSEGRYQPEHRRSELFQLPRTTFVRASQTIIKRASSSSGSIISLPPGEDIRVFVDRGTDAGGEPVEQADSASQTHGECTDETFEPVFGLVEDLIIHFTGGHVNEVFQSVFSSYRDGTYPASQSITDDEPPASPVGSDEGKSHGQPHITVESDDEGFHRQPEFDPYSSHNEPPPNYTQWPGRKNLSMTDSAVQDLELPTPSITSRPHSTSLANRFCEFSPVNRYGAIGVQNAFRAFLGTHFPSGENGYTQHYFPASQESDRLWKPVWRNDESASIGNEGRTVDQIIAFGCEDGVKKDFFNLVAAQIERLGSKRGGFNRSGRLDLSYLISNAMQTSSTGLIRSTHSTTNPLSNPTFLASLLVPHLEAYLATNDDIRLLILTYPAAHLATAIALQKLIGQDVFKIAGVLDSLVSDPLSFKSGPRTASSAHPLSNQAASSPSRKTSVKHSHANSIRSLQKQTSFHQINTSEAGVSFSKANYLLPCVATDTEISNFLTGITKPLIEKSTFYTPEPEIAPIIVEKIVEKFIEKPTPLPPPTPTSTQPPVSFRQPKEPRESKISRLTGGEVPKPRSRGHTYAASISSTIRTTGSERARRERRNDEGWGNFYIGEEDSEDDAYDRMIMGRSGARIVPEVKQAGKKRSSKKALKWLGLA